MTQCFAFDGFDERSLGDLWTAYRDLDAAFDDSEEEVTPEKVKAAMRVEESRIHTEPEISDDPQLAELQKMMGISKRMAENYKRIANEIEAEEKEYERLAKSQKSWGVLLRAFASRDDEIFIVTPFFTLVIPRVRHGSCE
jgi:hypothetical protein